jgi:hypothetical protein
MNLRFDIGGGLRSAVEAGGWLGIALAKGHERVGEHAACPRCVFAPIWPDLDVSVARVSIRAVLEIDLA